MKIYTKTGDSGDTSLFGGSRVPKNDERVELYGTLDELNAFIGSSASFMEESLNDLKADLQEIQSLLFEMGSMFSNPEKNKISAAESSDISRIEKKIDTYTEELDPIKNFILPGGLPASSMLHAARTVCRRLQRMMVAQKNITGDKDLIYINRLSDFLFCAARVVNKRNSVQDIIWKKRDK